MSAAQTTRAGNEWLAEGFRQLRLAVPWVGALRCLGRAPADGAAARLDEALKAFLDAAWLPGCREAADRLAADAVTHAGPAAAAGLVAAFERRARQGWGKDARIDGLRGCQDSARLWSELEKFLTDRLADGAGRAPAADAPPPDASRPALEPVAFVDMPRWWCAQAAALARLLALREELGRLSEQAEAAGRWGDLPERCAATAGELAERTQVGPLWRWLTALEFPGDRELLTRTGELMARCAEALAALQSPPPAVAALFDGRDELAGWLRAADAALADLGDWPPLALVRLAEAARAAGTALAADFLTQAAPDPAALKDWKRLLTEQFRGVPLPDLGCAALLRGVVEALDRPPSAGHAAGPLREALARFAEQLLRGRGLTAEALTEWVDRRPELVRTSERPDADRRSLVRTGLLLRAREGRAELPFPRAEWTAPPPRPLVDALDLLAGWLARRSAPDHGLSLLCRDLAQALAAGDGPAAWWTRAPAAERAALWRLVNRAALLAETDPDAARAVTPLFEALADDGFALEPGEALRGRGEEGVTLAGPWFLVPAPAAEVGAAARRAPWRGPVLRTPDGLLGPTVWLRLPPAPPAAGPSHPLADCLVAAEPLLTELALRDRDWPGWSDVNLTVSVLTLTPGADGAVDRSAALRLFETFYRRVPAAPSALQPAYRGLARALHQCLTGPLGMEVWPPLDPQTLAPQLLTGPVEAPGVTWVPAPERVGTVRKFRHFGTREDAQFEVSLGPVPAALQGWLNLPLLPPPLAGAAALTGWRERLWRALWLAPAERDPQVAAAEREARQAFTAWLDRPEGRQAFHRLADEARRGDGPARRWLGVLQAAGWCGCFPAVDPRTGEVSWPATVSLRQPGLTCAVGTEAAPPVRVAAVERFAPDAAGARCTLRLAPPPPDSAAGAAERLARVAADGPLATAARDLAAAERDRHYLGLETATPETLAQAALAQLVQARPGAGDAAADAWLEALRDWAGRHGLAVLPRRWRFQQPPRLDQLDADERAEAVPVFAAAAPGTVCEVGQFGLRGRAAEQACRLQVSVGPPPPGYNGLRALARNTSPELARRLDGWPAEAHKGTLEQAAVDLFLTFHDTVKARLQPRVRAAAEQFGDTLTQLLEEKYGLTAVAPKSYDECPLDWLDVRSNNATSGKVKVLRPGLKNRDGGLRVQAVVEIE